MAKSEAILFSFFLLVNISLLCSANEEERKVHIVYMGSLPDEREYSLTSQHLSLLQEVVGDGSSLDNLLVTSYKRSFNGFAAKLTNSEAEKLASTKGVVSVFPSKKLHFHTTRSWDFMGLYENNSMSNPDGAPSDVIIGIIDSGIWPESPSFNDKGFGPPPQRWKGECQGGQNFTCNNKIVGARHTFSYGTARDDVGHGTHTASTAAGNKVKDISFYGLKKGIARGGLPSARIAVYKACGPDGCNIEEVLDAFDNAIADGVDIISVSLGADFAVAFASDTVAIGAFHAMERGILTLNSAGNFGPRAASVSAVAPWLLSVAASTIDPKIIDKVVLGNGKTLIGNAVNPFTLNGTKFPLIYGADASTLCSVVAAQSCSSGCLNSTLVKGKIVVCDRTSGYGEAQRAGAVGSILLSNTIDNIPLVYSFPSTALSSNDYDSVQTYLSSTKTPTAEILRSETDKDSAAPVVASFSSRGPNAIEQNILKPDVTAPGVNILAAYIPFAPAVGNSDGKKLIGYNLLSGTSMSCPHAAAVAAYVKSVHPDWSPSAIQSAIMTTAWPMDASKNSDGEFAYGSGHINPVKAGHPGLVYEALKSDYIKYLCTAGYDEGTIRLITRDNSTCPKGYEKASTTDFNYPSMTVRVTSMEPIKAGFYRIVTNVGHSNSTYKAKVSSNSKLKIKVVPEILSFKSIKEKKSFNLTVVGEGLPDRTFASASLVWSDGIHNVRSPILVHTM